MSDDELIDTYYYTGGENWEFTGVTKTKGQVHYGAINNPYEWHACSHLGITDGKGNVLETMRGEAAGGMRGLRDPVSVAGHIPAVPPGAPRQSLHVQAWQTAVREAQEELGLDINPDWFGTPNVIYLGVTFATRFTEDNWFDRAFSLNFMCCIPDIAKRRLRLEKDTVLDPQMRPASQLLQRALSGREPYANRPPDQEKLLKMIMQGAAHFANLR